MTGKNGSGTLGEEDRAALFGVLRERFETNMVRHEGLEWARVRTALEANPQSQRSLFLMEESGGEPDVAGQDETSGEYLFYDCSAESPVGRRSVCYDRQALDSRKTNKPSGSAVEMAAAMGAELLTEQEYRGLQELGDFDTKTSSWLHTPPSIRSLGGAIFGDFRYGTVFKYHNSAGSYYAARGFRCVVRV